MTQPPERALEETPWNLAVDDEAEELHIEHGESGDTYVFDAEGNLRVPGDGDVDGTLREVRDALASALPDGTQGDTHEDVSGDGCSVECDSETGELRLRSDEGITLNAPTVDIDPEQELSVSTNAFDVLASQVSIESRGETTIDANSGLNLTTSATLALDGGLVEATASGPMTLQGALIKLN
jgi:hypothetical protein